MADAVTTDRTTTHELNKPSSSTLSRSQSALEKVSTTRIRFNSVILTRESSSIEENVRVESPSSSPFELQIDELPFSSDDSRPTSPTSPIIKKKHIIPSSRIGPIPEETDGATRIVKVSEYRSPENAPFELVSPESKPIKLHRYLLVSPRVFLSLSLFSFLALTIVLIGFGIAFVQVQSQLNYRCPTISYCPKNTTYTVVCNTTNGFCGCYDTNDQLMGCFIQRQYGQGCYRAQECSSRSNLNCNMTLYQCQCLTHYMFNGSSCIPMPSYGGICSISNDTCDRAFNLTCLAGGVCSCNTSVTFWNGQYCEVYRSFNNPCNPYATPTGCSVTFTCDNTTALCKCLSSTAIFDGTACLPYSSYLEPCYDSTTCTPGSSLSCTLGICQCDDLFYYWSPTLLTCVYPKHVAKNTTCDYQTGCESDFGLKCINNLCTCELNSYWTPGNYCDTQSQYNEQCLTAPCLAYTGLVCSNTTLTCICPTYYYWDGYVCQAQRTYNAFCQADTWCRMDSGMRCRNSMCSCSVCSTCFWDGIRCRDCPTSWQVVTSTGTIQPRVYCYWKVNSYANWNESWTNCLSAATSYFGPTSHLVYMDDAQERQDLSIFATNTYYDIFIGHTNQFNYSRWYLNNGTISPSFSWCPGINTTFNTLQCSRLLISASCVTNIMCYGWTSRYVCELD